MTHIPPTDVYSIKARSIYILRYIATLVALTVCGCIEIVVLLADNYLLRVH